jgi:uncharacterized protein
MKKKYITETYLKGVDDYDIKIIKEDNCYVSVKHIKSIDTPYIETHTEKNICLLDVGYYIIEYLPINENYCVRVFMNKEKEVLQYYIDITKKNDVEDGKPFYYDLYLDITIDMNADKLISIWDEDEIKEAVDLGKISEDDMIMAYKVMNNLLEQIFTNNNSYINRNHKELIEKMLV